MSDDLQKINAAASIALYVVACIALAAWVIVFGGMFVIWLIQTIVP